jgi:type IV secretory pathway protease TraF
MTVVTIDAQSVRVNGGPLPNSIAKRVDRAGRPLASQPFGAQNIPVGYVWLYATNVWSADSRYGAVPVDTIRYRARPSLRPSPDLRGS